MLDELLGRATLKERIEELENELARMTERYEAESNRRADAVTEKQAAEERQNRLEDRIAQLEGEIERLEAADGAATHRRHERLRGDRLSAVLERLRSVRTEPEGALTAVVTDDLPSGTSSVLGESGQFVRERTPCLLCLDDAGLITVVLDPPVLPTIEPTWSDGFQLEDAWFRPTGRHALVLVRADLFALGIFDGADLVDVTGFESDVKSSHSKGGFSQGRFERRRSAQIDEHLSRAESVVEREVADVSTRYLVGDREAIDALEPSVDPTAVATVDASGKPREALEAAARSFWTTDLYVV